MANPNDANSNFKELFALWSGTVLKNVENNYNEGREARREAALVHSEIRKEIGQLHHELSELKTSIETFKTEMRFKAGVWGAVTGAIPGLIVWLIWWLQRAATVAK